MLDGYPKAIRVPYKSDDENVSASLYVLIKHIRGILFVSKKTENGYENYATLYIENMMANDGTVTPLTIVDSESLKRIRAVANMMEADLS